MRIRSGGLASGRFMSREGFFEKSDSTLEIEGECGRKPAQSEGPLVGCESGAVPSRLFQGNPPAGPGPGSKGMFCDDFIIKVRGDGPVAGQLGQGSGQFEVMQMGDRVGWGMAPDFVPGEGRIAGPGQQVDLRVKGRAADPGEMDPCQKERLGCREVSESYVEPRQSQTDGRVPRFEGQCLPEAADGMVFMPVIQVAPGFEKVQLHCLGRCGGRGGMDVQGLGDGHGRRRMKSGPGLRFCLGRLG